MSNKSIIATLTKLAEENKSRADFNRAVKAAFPVCLGAGAFRKVYDAGDVVIKLRRHEPRRNNAFPMSQIDSSNSDEASSYLRFKKANPIFAHFILQPTLITLPNGHDAVLMEKVDFVWGSSAMLRRSVENNRHDIHNHIQVISLVFMDSHDNNVGIKGNRAYLIDFNFCGTWTGMQDYKERARNVLEAVGIKFRGRKPKKALMAMEAGA